MTVAPLNNDNSANTEENPSGRSARSLAFQKAWASLAGPNAIPDKADFRPEHFAPFMPIIYLLELHEEPERRLIFRLAGQHVRENLGLNLRGRNYTDFVPPEHRENSGMSMFRMFGAPPCGRWVRKELIHRDGHRQIAVLTQLPMTFRAEGKRLVLGIVEGFDEDPQHDPDGSFRFESHTPEHFIDIGERLPE